MTGPPQLNDGYAAVFAAPKRELVADGGTLRQVGAASIPGAPPRWPAAEMSDQPTIETFLVDGASDPVPLGADAAFNEAWADSVRWMADAMFGAIDALSIPTSGPAYLTASCTRTDQVLGTAHVDDDQYVADEGIGLVAICGELAGPRIAIGELEHPPIRSPSQIVVDESQLARFERNELPHQQADADSIVLFPQFAQVHAGPDLQALSAPGMRRLMVFRVSTRGG